MNAWKDRLFTRWAGAGRDREVRSGIQYQRAPCGAGLPAASTLAAANLPASRVSMAHVGINFVSASIAITGLRPKPRSGSQPAAPFVTRP